LEIVGSGRAVTVRLAALLPGPATGASLVVTPEVELGFTATFMLVTLKVTVQLVLAGMLMPLKVRAVAPAERDDGVVPVHDPPTAPPSALMLTRVSLKAPPVNGVPLVLLRVRVTRELPPD
jgi:hypothetical protein